MKWMKDLQNELGDEFAEERGSLVKKDGNTEVVVSKDVDDRFKVLLKIDSHKVAMACGVELGEVRSEVDTLLSFLC